MKIAIIGSRTFKDYNVLCGTLDWLNSTNENSDNTIVSGGAIGADSLGEKWAKTNGWKTEIYKADWEKYGKSAGFRRNEDIIKNSELVVAFWDGLSKGTQHSLGLAKKYKIDTFIVYF